MPAHPSPSPRPGLEDLRTSRSAPGDRSTAAVPSTAVRRPGARRPDARHLRLGARRLLLAPTLGVLCAALVACEPQGLPSGQVPVQAPATWRTSLPPRTHGPGSIIGVDPVPATSTRATTTTSPRPTKSWITTGPCVGWRPPGGRTVQIPVQVTAARRSVRVAWQADGAPNLLRYRAAAVPQALVSGAQPAPAWVQVTARRDCTSRTLTLTLTGLGTGQRYVVWLDAVYGPTESRPGVHERGIGRSILVVPL